MKKYSRFTDDDLNICTSAIVDLITDKETGKTRLSGQGFDYADTMRSLLRFSETITKENEREMIPRPVVNKRNMIMVTDRSWRRLYRPMLPAYINMVQKLPSEYRYAEEIEAFRECCAAHPAPDDFELFQDFCKQPTKYYGEPDYEELRSFVNEFIKDFRRRLRDPKTRQKILDRSRGAKKNFKRGCGYVKRQFDTRSRLIAISLILYYKNEINATLEDIAKDLTHFKANQRHNKIFMKSRGYIVKIECGMDRGIHAHLIFFFDGSVRDNNADIYFTKKIGEYWANQITKGRGTYWNCNADKKQFEIIGQLGVGVIHADDKKKRENLLRIVKYLCKKEQFIKPISNPKFKLFRLGQWPELKLPKPGAPRKSERISKPLSGISETQITPSVISEEQVIPSNQPRSKTVILKGYDRPVEIPIKRRLPQTMLKPILANPN